MGLGELSSEERAIVVAALLDGAGPSAPALARLAEPSRSRCSAELAAVSALGREERVRTIVQEVRRAVAVPPALREGTHASWFDAPLATESNAVRAAVRGDHPAEAPVKRWLARSLWGRLVPMPAPLKGPPVRWADVPRVAGDLLQWTVLTMGREEAPRRLAPALAHAGGDVLAETAQKLPRDLGERFLTAPRDADSAGFPALFEEFLAVMAKAPR